MTDYGEYRQPSRGPSLMRPATNVFRRSLTRNSYYSHDTPSVTASTRSWVYSTQQNPPGPPLPPPPPLPIPLPSPVQRLRPLPNPHVQQHQQHRAAALHAVNPSEPLNHEEDEERMDVYAHVPDDMHFAYQKGASSKVRNVGMSSPNSAQNSKGKKKTVMRGFVKSIRRLPKIMFGYGASSKEPPTLRRRVNLDTDGERTPTSVTPGTGNNSLPQYVSNPPTPVAGPIPSNVHHHHHYTHQPMEIQMPRPISIPMTVPVSVSPPPEVVRLDDVRRHRANFRIMPPSTNIARSEIAHFFPGPNAINRQSSQFADNPTDSSSSAANTAERTTVMLYHHDQHTPPTLTPPLPLSRQISSSIAPGRLSYVGSEKIVRPTSFHGGSQAPPPIEIPTSIPRMATPSSHLSYVSSTLPLHIRHSSSQQRSQPSNQSQSQSQLQPQLQSQPQSQPQPQPPSQPQPQARQYQHQPTSLPQHHPSSTPPIIESSEPIQSPISAHPQPTTDYLKMALSPPHSFQHTNALTHLTSTTNPSSSRITSFSYDPSFSDKSSPIERFFKTLYRMPWIAYERITVDYLPGNVGRVHGHTLGREMKGKGERRRREGDRRKTRTKDTIERGRDGERDRRRRKGRRSGAGGRSHGHGDGKPLSWYKAVLPRSRRISAELDLLSSNLGSHSSPTTTTSLGAAIGLGLQNLPADAASPKLAAAAAAAAAANIEKSAERERERERERRKANAEDKEERTSHSRRQHQQQDPQNDHSGRQRQKTGSDPGGHEQEDKDESWRRAPSPLIPAVYPFHYPPYPYTYPYTAFTMPPPHPQSQPHSVSSSSKNPRRPRNSANHKHHQGQQPLLYNPGIPHSGYTAPTHAYQPMIAPQVYLLHSTSHGQLHVQAQAQMQMQQPLTSSSGGVDNRNGGEGGVVVVGDVGDGDLGPQQALEQ